MIRNLKALGLACVVVFAMSAVAASAAQASAHMRCGEGETGKTCRIVLETHPQSPIQKFKTDVGTVECKTFTAEYNGPKTVLESATLTNVGYGTCTVGGALPATVNFGTCDYTLESPFETVATKNEKGEVIGEHGRGGVTIGPAGCTVTITVSVKPCTITVPGGQFFAGAITYTNVQTEKEGKKLPEEITGHATVPGPGGKSIKYSYKGTACGEGNNIEDGTYEGTFTARAFATASEGGAQTNLTTVDT